MIRIRTTLALALVAALAVGALAKEQQFFHSHSHGHGHDHEHGAGMKRVFDALFPFDSPAYNSVLATFYISSVPNFILLAVPATLEPSSLNTMIAFATGGLLGDVFLHLVPHAFFGEGADRAGPFVVEEKRNIIIGGAIFLGFAAFFVLDKSMRVLNASAGNAGHSHSHSHTHAHGKKDDGASWSANVSARSSAGDRSRRKSRKSPADVVDITATPPAAAAQGASDNPSLRLSAYLNLFGDFTHNITDGLAMAASFYSSPALGAVTTIATFCHEIPHEIADYSILIKSGFTKTQAMGSQFFTAVGAFVGTFLGIWIAESTGGVDKVALQVGEGIFGTSAGWGELVIPMTAGGFLYIASVSVVPELLAESTSARQAAKEYAAMAFGVLCMAAIAWNE
ncbi:hypothetical protein Q5752_001288 [Cryptotrichosporon argae]